jgi:transcriptional regulator with XRE-family HTH domain
VEVPRLRSVRLATVLTQAELAARAGVNETTVVAAEQSRKVRISTVRKLAEALGVEPQVLLASDDDPPAAKEGR